VLHTVLKHSLAGCQQQMAGLPGGAAAAGAAVEGLGQHQDALLPALAHEVCFWGIASCFFGFDAIASSLKMR
jgi:hypothetical protein